MNTDERRQKKGEARDALELACFLICAHLCSSVVISSLLRRDQAHGEEVALEGGAGLSSAGFLPSGDEDGVNEENTEGRGPRAGVIAGGIDDAAERGGLMGEAGHGVGEGDQTIGMADLQE